MPRSPWASCDRGQLVDGGAAPLRNAGTAAPGNHVFQRR